MGLSDLISKVTGTTKSKKGSVVDQISKVAEAMGIDLTQVLSLVMKNQDVIEILGKLGLKKKDDPASAAVQKLVGSLKTTINKASGIKIDDDTFGSLVNKLMGNDKIKGKVEDIAGSGVATFIKKAVKEYIS